MIYKAKDKYNLKIRAYRKFPIVKLLLTSYHLFRLSWDFAIFSGYWIKNIKSVIYDEAFVNGCEDYYTFFEIWKSGRYCSIGYRISSIGGGTFGGNLQRGLRELAGLTYSDKIIFS